MLTLFALAALAVGIQLISRHLREKGTKTLQILDLVNSGMSYEDACRMVGYTPKPWWKVL